jgi:predicted flap endonuclease-1-like 5' DNA nuclease
MLTRILNRKLFSRPARALFWSRKRSLGGMMWRVLMISAGVLLWWLMRHPEETEEELQGEPREIILPDEPLPAVESASSGRAEARRAAPIPVKMQKKEEEPEAQESSAEQEEAPAQVDDLKIIEGIGPRIAELLTSCGITTFRQLGETPVERLEEILRSANLRLADATTWPEQARLAAEGDLEGLGTLQGQLKAGRRVG